MFIVGGIFLCALEVTSMLSGLLLKEGGKQDVSRNV